MESDPVRSETVFPAFKPKSIVWWILWLLLSIQLAAILILVSTIIPNSDMISIGIICFSAILTGWFLPSFGKKKFVFPAAFLINFIMIVLIQSSTLIKILKSYSLLINGIAEHGSSTSFAFHITSSLQSFWQFLIDIANEVPFLLGDLKSQETMFQFSWSILLWVCLFMVVCLIRKKVHALIAFIPLMFVITYSTIYTSIKSVTVIITLSILLVSCILLELIKKEIYWKNSEIDYSPEIRFETITLSFPIIIITILFAGLIPEIDLEDIHRKWDELTERKEAITSQYDSDAKNNDQTTSPGVSNYQKGIMPRSHLIGSGPELSTREVMTFQVNDVMIAPDSDQLQEPPRYYLSGSIFDYYTGKGWLTSSIISTKIQPNKQINSIPTEGYRLIIQTIDKKGTAPDLVFVAGSLISVNVPVDVNYRSEHDLFSAVTDSHIYSGYSFIDLQSENELRGDQEPTPQWILERYLQLPTDLPDRIRQLALNITYDQETSYDKALAIQTYLRRFPYSLDLPQPPETGDVIDYFLFEAQKGYCDYFASAMVILARVIGIPARLVVGYTSGNYDFNDEYYVITEENAHAWPELYFSSSGWIIFEPTSNFPTVESNTEEIETEHLHELDYPEIAFLETQVDRSITYLFLTFGILVFGFLYWLIKKHQKTFVTDHSLTNEQEKIIRSFKIIVERSKYLGIRYQASMTPLEFLDSFKSNLIHGNSPKISAKYQDATIKLLEKFVNLYNLNLFREYAPQEISRKESITIVRSLRANLLFLRFFKRS